MKIEILLTALLLASAPLLSAATATNDLTALLQQGLFDEEANRDLTAAIADYQSLATQFDRDRQVAATAIYRLGECYRKLGQTNEATVQYERLVRDFADQKDLVTLSRQNLTGLGVAPQSQIAERPQPIASAQLQAQQKLLEDEIKVVEQELADQQQLVRLGTLPTHGTLPTEQKLLELKRQLLAVGTGELVSPQPATAPTDDEAREIVRIQQMLQNSPDLINMPGEDHDTPLTKAAANGWLKVAAYLLDHGADINAKSGGELPLIAAARNAQKSMVELLLNRGAEVNARGPAGNTALIEAARAGYPAVVAVLLARKADANEVETGAGNWSETPLHLAAQGGYANIIHLLLAAGANPNAPDGRPETPLFPAVAKGSTESVKLLLAAGADPNVENINGRTPLSFAVEKGWSDLLNPLLAAKADPNAGTLDAPLLGAVYRNNVPSAKLLLQAGANPNAMGSINWGVSINGRAYGSGFPPATVSPLALAICHNQLPLVQLLLQSKADPNEVQSGGHPLVFSALSDTNILDALLSAGAKVDVYDSSSSSDVPSWGGLPSPGTFQQRLAALTQDNQHNAADNVSSGQPLLYRAVGDKFSESVAVLLKHGANPNLPDGSGNTPLHAAAEQLADQTIFELLLAARANPNVRNHAGKTPLDLLKENAEGLPPGIPRPLRPGAPGEASDRPDRERLAQTERLAGLLRQHGALDEFPDWDRITVSRPSVHYAHAVFNRGTNDWNQFSLLELIYACAPGPMAANTSLQFADLAHLIVVRTRPGELTSRRLAVNLLNPTNGLDCTKDIPLEFGDIVEIPEREHTLAEQGLVWSQDQYESMFNYLKAKAGAARLFVAGGQTVLLPLQPYGSRIGMELVGDAAKRALTSDSDLSRVKVTRHDPQTGKTRQWILDRKGMNQNNPYYADHNDVDLLLRDGDVIEVPEKP